MTPTSSHWTPGATIALHSPDGARIVAGRVVSHDAHALVVDVAAADGVRRYRFDATSGDLMEIVLRVPPRSWALYPAAFREAHATDAENAVARCGGAE